MSKELIVGLLKKLEEDNNAMAELEIIPDRDKVVYIAIENKMIKALAKLFTPVEFDSKGEKRIIIFYDIFTFEEFSNRLSMDLTLEELKELYDLVYPILLREHEYDGLVGKMIIKDTHARELPMNLVNTRGVRDVLRFSEPACFLANLDLYQKNIVTVDCDTACVMEDHFNGDALCYIVIDYDKLTERNKVYGQDLIGQGKAKFDIIDDLVNNTKKYRLVIFTKCNNLNTVREVSDRLLLMTNKFETQDITEGKYTMDEYYEKLYPELEKFAYAGGDFDKYFPTGEVYPLELLEFEKKETANGLFSKTIYDESCELFFKDEVVRQRYNNYLKSIKNNS